MSLGGRWVGLCLSIGRIGGRCLVRVCSVPCCACRGGHLFCSSGSFAGVADCYGVVGVVGVAFQRCQLVNRVGEFNAGGCCEAAGQAALACVLGAGVDVALLFVGEAHRVTALSVQVCRVPTVWAVLVPVGLGAPSLCLTSDGSTSGCSTKDGTE